MQYVKFGNTGMKVSRLCLGMMSYGSKKWREWILEEGEARPFVQRAWMRVSTSLTRPTSIRTAPARKCWATFSRPWASAATQ